MNERESAKVIPLWNRPSTWGICICILLIAVAVLNGKPKAQATTATIQEPITPQPVTTQKPETPVIVKPMTGGDSNASNANNNTNKAGGHIINGNGNRVIITNHHHHYHINNTAKQPTPAKPTPKQPTKPQSQECEDHMAEHLAQVAKWESMFK